MNKTQQIKAQLVGQNAIIVVIAAVANHLARKYQIEVSSDTIMVACLAGAAWLTSRHVDSTSLKLDTAALLAGLTFPEVKAIADRAGEMVADPNNPINTTKDAILATMAQVAEVQRQIPEIGIKDAITVSKGGDKAEVKD